MNIMVFDVSAESGGALSIVNDFYNKFKEDENNEYIIIVSKLKLKQTNNIKILQFPWIKKSWLHRLYFDNFIAPKLIKKNNAEEVLSLQNIMIPHTRVDQTVYVHNSLPFIEFRFSVFDNKLLWCYQNIISRFIFKSIKKTNKVIVQTQWMKRACIDKLKLDGKKIEVMAPKIDIKVKKIFEPDKENLSTFFYPASGYEFKNHKLVVEACIELKKRGIENYKVLFTLQGDENNMVSDLYEKSIKNKLPISFLGSLSREDVFAYYSKSVLLFPSYIESVGMPLIEAKAHETPILASDCAFSHEVLRGYKKASFFDSFNSTELRKAMEKSIRGIS